MSETDYIAWCTLESTSQLRRGRGYARQFLGLCPYLAVYPHLKSPEYRPGLNIVKIRRTVGALYTSLFLANSCVAPRTKSPGRQSPRCKVRRMAHGEAFLFRNWPECRAAYDVLEKSEKTDKKWNFEYFLRARFVFVLFREANGDSWCSYFLL